VLQAPLYAIALFTIAFLLATGAALRLFGRRETAVFPSSPLDWLEASFAALLLTVVGVGWAATLLASFGQFSLLTLALLTLAAAGVGWWAQRPFTLPQFARPTRYEYLLLLGLVGFAILYARPHEYIFGGTDAGSYTHISATLAQTGKFVLQDEWTAVLRDHAEATLREQPPQWRTRYLQFVGWYVGDSDPARVIPQFFPFHPVWMAIGASLGGLMGSWLVTPLWAVLGLTAVYLLTRALFNRPAALLAALLLGLTPTHLYFARYPTTEPLTLLLVFTSLLALQRLWDEGERADPLWGILGGAALGAAFLTRIDLPVLLALVLAALSLRWLMGRWSAAFTAFALTLAVFTLHATLSALLISWPYTWNTYSSVLRILNRSGALIAVAVVALVVVGGTAVLWRTGHLTREKLGRWARSPYLHGGAAIFILLLSAYAYFARPILQPVTFYTNWPSGTQVPQADGQNWLRMGWYLTPLGVLLATVGAAWIVWRKPWWRYGLFMAVGLLTTTQYVYRIFNTAYHIYAVRRYVPIVIPMLLIYAAVILVVLAQRQPTRYYRLLAGALAIVLAAGLLFQARYVLPLREYAGAAAQMAALHEALEPGALLIINEPPDLNVADRLGVPLRFLYGHDIATIRGSGEEIRPFLAALLAEVEGGERPLQLLAIHPLDPVIRQTLPLHPESLVTISTQLLKNSFTEFPTEMQNVYHGIEIYNVTAQPAPPTLPLTIDIGGLDSLYIEEGFYAKDPRPGEITSRWTGENATLQIPLPAAETVEISLRAIIFRPEEVEAAPVIVLLDGKPIGQFTPDRVWQTYTFSGASAPQDGYSTLQLQSATFNPASLGRSQDSRDLGFLLDWVRIR
jgi:4-amino-4-deoxy-L-arabinose transferase-like glycosyltransferase